MNRKSSFIHRLLQGLRVLSQVLFFSWFIYLLINTHYSGKDYIAPVESFFHFDPLLGLTTLIASRQLFRPMLWALIIVGLTLLFGRFVCGWACPLGAILQFISYLSRKMRWYTPKDTGSRLLHLKYGVLLAVIAASVVTLDLSGFFDPLSLLYRSFIVVVLPGAALAGEAALQGLSGNGLNSVGERFGGILQNLTINKTFEQGFVIGAVFLAVILLSLYRERFWCRYLCPAGALLGLLSRWNLVKVKVDKQKCTECKVCTLHCQTQATPFPNRDWRPGECVYCYTCAANCPAKAITFPIRVSPAGKAVDFPRRKWIFSTALGLAVIPLFRVTSSAKRPSGQLIRPPGALPEPKFLAACVRCGECIKVCPTNGLQPASTQAGPEGLWTPVLVPKIGYCEYYCSLCTQVCPTGAIKELKLKEKAKVRIGSAWINKNRCIPYALGEACSVCEEKCPTSPKAIKFIEAETALPDGSPAGPALPVVDLDQCIGCGICETKCPVYDDPAIYCTSLGESRFPGDSSV